MNELFIYALAFLFGLGVYRLIIFVLSALRRWKLNDHSKVTVHPSEEDLRRRDEENSRKAFLKYSTRKSN